MKQRWLIAPTFCALLCTSPSAAATQGSAGDTPKQEKNGAWRLSESKGQCDASKPLYPSLASQFVIGITKNGTHLTLQSVRWRLPSTPTNSMPVKITFDRSPALSTDALLIAFIGVFQVFINHSPMPEAQFWDKFLGSRTMRVTGPFSPGSVDVDLGDAAQAIPLLEDCAQRQLPGRTLPFHQLPVPSPSP